MLKHLLRMGTGWQMHRFRHIISADNHLWRLEFNYISVFKSCLFRHQWVTLTYLMLLPGCFWQSTLSLSLSSCQSPSLVPSLEKQQEKQRLSSELCNAPAKPHPPLCPQKTTLYKSKHWRMSKSNKKTIKQIKVKVTSNYLFWQQDFIDSAQRA